MIDKLLLECQVLEVLMKKGHECLLLHLKPKKLEKELECENGLV